MNLSTRGRAETGDNVLIGGFIISGDSPKTVVLRAIGPSLASAGVVDALADPSLQLVDSLGGVIDSNDNWMDNADEQAILDASLAPSDPSESAVIDTLDPGSYTAIVTGVDGTQNIALVEVFDLDSLGTSQLLNISTRGFVDLGDGVMIAGFIIGGTEAEDVVVRGLGPSLANPPAIVANPLADPVLELFDPNGLALAVNDNWQDTQAAAISAVGLAPTNVNEAAIFATLLPGSYTAMLFDANGTTGVGLVEVFNVTNSP